MITFSEFVDVVLYLLYHFERMDVELGSSEGTFYELHSFAPILRDRVPHRWFVDCGKILESRGLAQCVFALGGLVKARITGLGRLYVEEKRSQLIQDVVNNPDKYLKQSQMHVQPKTITSIEEERKPALQVLEDIQKKIKSEQRIGEIDRNEILADINSVADQLRKREPNRSALAAILDPLSRLPLIAEDIASLIEMVNY